MSHTHCNEFDPEIVYNRFKLIEFPTSFVGLSTSQYLDVEVDLDLQAYYKTTYNGKLLEFEKAREISEAHRAYTIERVDSHTLKITFKPSNECIAKLVMHGVTENRFLFDLRVINIEGSRCCNKETHSEIGRFYISGRYEFCNISHNPKVLNYDAVVLHDKVVKYVRIRNESQLVAAKVKYIKVTNYDVIPKKITIPPNGTKRLQVNFKPSSEGFPKLLKFAIRNAYDDCCDDDLNHFEDDNFVSYTIQTEATLVYDKIRQPVEVPSQHMLNEPNPLYKYIGDELISHNERKIIAKKIFIASKKLQKESPLPKHIFFSKKDKCESKLSYFNLMEAMMTKKINTYFVLNIILVPFKIHFGRIGVNTYGAQEIAISNDSEFDVTLSMLKNDFILYTKKKYSQYKLKLKACSTTKFTILCYGSPVAPLTGSFDYLIDHKFHKSHMYSLEVGHTLLMIEEPSLKFGMVTSEFFITSIPIRIYNHFNEDVDFEWKDVDPDTPFQITPTHGTVLKKSATLCDVTYVVHTSKPTKTKTYEIEMISKGQVTKVIPVELTIVTKKISVKFLHAAVNFEDIALNIETKEKVKLENSSREIVSYVVSDPSIPGISIEPMSGILQPKMIINFIIKVTIACLIEFEFEMLVKLNNKDTIGIPVYGNVVEPKLTVHPRTVYIPRLPNGLVSYVSVTFQNTGILRSIIDIDEKKDQYCNAVFPVFVINGYDKIRVESFFVDPGQSKTVYIKVHDVYIREYNMCIPFRINGQLGPPAANTSINSFSLDHHYYTRPYEVMYENNPSVRLKSINKDIPYFNIGGVITVPWIEISEKKFVINYAPDGDNNIDFTMKNVSRFCLTVTIHTGKIGPNFSLEVTTVSAETEPMISENIIKLELYPKEEANFSLKFHPRGYGRYVVVAVFFIDRSGSLPYSDLTFTGTRQVPEMTSSINQIIFPNSFPGIELHRSLSIKVYGVLSLDGFHCSTDEEPCLTVKFVNIEVLQDGEEDITIVEVNIAVYSEVNYARKVTLYFDHDCGSRCGIDLYFCFTCCPLTMHFRSWITLEYDPYPYYPLSTQTEYYEYMENCKSFLERWLFQQGFHRELYPKIPETFFNISDAVKSKSMNASFLNFMRRIAGPLMKNVRKTSCLDLEEPYKSIKEIHDTYQQIIHLVRSRGGHAVTLEAMFLLSYDQFVIFTDNFTSNDLILIQELKSDPDLFQRRNIQAWIDFILQIYKVFVTDSCFFDCVCLSSEPRDVVRILIAWYNENIHMQYIICPVKSIPKKITINNLTSDLSDGSAIMSVFLVYCPFLKDQFLLFETDENDPKATTINNASLIIEAMNHLKLFFPLTVKDFLEPNFLHMLFLSIHLFVLLPTIKPKEILEFCPPFLKTSLRQLVITPLTQESLMYTFMVLYNKIGCFGVEKVQLADSGKKMCMNLTYTANSTKTETAYLLVYGYNKARIFDTYLMFHLIGNTGALIPMRKCKVTGSLYRPNKVDILVSSPFTTTAVFDMFLTDVEPCMPVDFEELKCKKHKFCVQRLNLIDKQILLPRKDVMEWPPPEAKLYLQIICLSTLPASYWIWFRSDIGEFFIRVWANCRWDMPVEMMYVKLKDWPMKQCSCGESCECYRTTVLMIPHRNDLMLKALRCALSENASHTIMKIFDQLIVSATGHMILLMLLAEGGTNISDVQHILRQQSKFRITSKNMFPQLDRVTFSQHSDAVLALPVTVPANDKAERYTVTFTSETGAEIRNYRIVFTEQEPSFCTESSKGNRK